MTAALRERAADALCGLAARLLTWSNDIRLADRRRLRHRHPC